LRQEQKWGRDLIIVISMFGLLILLTGMIGSALRWLGYQGF
jgi:hypothetical protein